MLVNNAGYGYQASIKEGEEGAIRVQVDADVFDLFAMDAVTQRLRERLDEIESLRAESLATDFPEA